MLWRVEVLRDYEWVCVYSSPYKLVAVQHAGHELQRGVVVRLREW